MLKTTIRGYRAVIGLTGGIGSGKSHARECLASFGAITLDADSLAHETYKSGVTAFKDIVSTFGAGILNPSGEIDRRALGSIVFASSEKLEQLNAIVWPAVRIAVSARLAEMIVAVPADHCRVAVVEAALLIEAGWATSFDEVWITYVPEATAIARVVERNGISEAEALDRIRKQMPIEERVKHGEVVIDTSGSKDQTRRRLQKEWDELLLRIPSPTAAL